jgi:hypothetical protein
MEWGRWDAGAEGAWGVETRHGGEAVVRLLPHLECGGGGKSMG